MLDGWRQVVLGFQDGLVDLIATAAEQRTGYRPEARQVRRVLTDSRAELLPTAEDQAGPASAGGGPYFSRSAEDLYVPKPVGDTGIYASCHGAGSLIEQRAARVVELFGYPADSLAVQTC